jgi:hypothetical protein
MNSLNFNRIDSLYDLSIFRTSVHACASEDVGRMERVREAVTAISAMF